MACRNDQTCFPGDSILGAAALATVGMKYFLLDPVGNGYGSGWFNAELKSQRAQVLGNGHDTSGPPQCPCHHSPTKPVSYMRLLVASHGNGERTPKYQCQHGGCHALGVGGVGIDDFEPEASPEPSERPDGR